MAAEEGNNIVRGIFTGEEQPEDEVENEWGIWPIILRNVTHLSICQSLSVIREDAFHCHPNIIELICHIGLKKIEEFAFGNCPRLKRLVMSGVEEVEFGAFNECGVIEYVECDQLEKIRELAFSGCKSLGSIDLPSANIVEHCAFHNCTSLMDVKFGKNLESIGARAFGNNTALKRITIPLKSGLFTHDDVFLNCEKLDEVCLIEEAIVHETVGALLLDEWKNDMNDLISSINGMVQNASVGRGWVGSESQRSGEKTRVIREWISSVLSKIIHYKAQHRRLVNEAATVLSDILPNDILTNNILPFISLPSHTFDGEDYHNGDLLNSDERGQKRPKLDDH